MTEPKYGKHKTNLDKDILKEIEGLNFENWIHHNEELVEYIYHAHYKGREPHEVRKFSDAGGRRAGFTKLLRRGVQFGVISSGRHRYGGRPRLYRLTEDGVVYYEKMLKERFVLES